MARKEIRAMTDFFLIGPSSARFVGRNPPTLRQVLQIVLHKTTVLKNNLRESIKETLDDLIFFYRNQGIATANVYKLTEKVEKMHKEWQNICKHKTRSSSTERERREKFQTQLDEVFEVERLNDERIELKSKSVHTQTIESFIIPRTKRVSTSSQDTISSKQMRLDEIEGKNIMIC